VEASQTVGDQYRAANNLPAKSLLIRSRLAPKGKRLAPEIKTANGDFREHRSGSQLIL